MKKKTPYLKYTGFGAAIIAVLYFTFFRKKTETEKEVTVTQPTTLSPKQETIAQPKEDPNKLAIAQKSSALQILNQQQEADKQKLSYSQGQFDYHQNKLWAGIKNNSEKKRVEGERNKYQNEVNHYKGIIENRSYEITALSNEINYLKSLS